jgi:hypothetical protein
MGLKSAGELTSVVETVIGTSHYKNSTQFKDNKENNS